MEIDGVRSCGWSGPRLSLAVVVVALGAVGCGAGVRGDGREPPRTRRQPAHRRGVGSGGPDAGPALERAVRAGDRGLRPGGDRLTAADRRAVAAEVRELAPLASDGQRVFPVFAEDGKAAFVGVPLSTSIPESDLAGPVGDIRDAASTDLPDGLRAHVTGGPAFTVDLSKVFDGADTRLLATTAAVVALLLLLTYRSPWLWLVPLTVVGLADQVAAQALAAGTHVFGFAADGATTGITSVLVFGAGTNYALLLIARYREELRREADRYDAMRVALGRAAPAILASSGTVTLALLCLGVLASNPSSSAIGYAGAIGIVTAVGFALLVLPAAMTVFGRGLFWPFVPRVGDHEPTADGFWAKVAAVVTARPRLVTAVGRGAARAARAAPGRASPAACPRPSSSARSPSR